ncbi:MAG TPA: hypothetical protein VL860_12870 [Planctomycetota bacterium]|nr:hypothetical protein [Planctomycetota bacterium]
MKRIATLFFGVALCAGLTGCGPAPIDVRRADSPYLHTNIADEVEFIRYPVEPNADALSITNKDEMRTLFFWLNETFHNRPAYADLVSALSEADLAKATVGSLRIQSIQGLVSVQVWRAGEFEPQNNYATDRVTRDEKQSLIDDRYPDDQFYYVDTVVIECNGVYYRTYFFPRLLAPSVVKPH